MKLGHIHKEKVGALLFLMFSIAYGVSIIDIQIPYFAEEDVFTSKTLPTALAILGVVTSFLVLVLPAASNKKEDRINEVFKGLYWKDVILLVILMVIYGLTLKVLGFIISTIIFLSLGFWILGERRIKVILLSSIPLVVIFWYVLNELLGIYIDPGEIFYFIRGE